jgi:energy-coupling factor transporter ATP-binding protein EcfA2
VQPTNHKNGRFVVVAHKLRIDNMIVVAGPTSSGKSTLIENLRQARAPEVARALGISDMADWIAADMSMLSELGKSGKRNLILHYDITRRQFGNPIARSQYDLHDLIGIANKVTFLTIQVPQETLLLQHEEGVIKPQTKGGRFTGNVKHAKIARMYRRRDVVDSLYEQWFRIASRYEGAHFTVPSSDSSNVTKFSLQST